MNKNTKLIKDTVIYGIATLGPKAINVILLPVITNYFTTTEYGKWDLITTTISLILPYISFEILSAVYRWLLDKKGMYNRQQIISTGFFFTIRNIIVFNILGLLFMSFFNVSHSLLILLMTDFIILSDFIKKCVRGLSYNKQYALIGTIQTLITLLTQITCIFLLKLRIETFFIGSIIGNLTALLIGWNILQFHKYLSLDKYSKELIKILLNYSAPMIPAAASWWVMNTSDRYVISIYLGLSANGVYSIASKLPSIINMLKSIFQLAWQDSAILSYNDKDRDQYYSNIFKHYFRLLTSSCIVLISINPILMKLIVAERFYEAWKYTGILYIGTIFEAFSSFWGAAYHSSKNTKIILKTTLIGAVVNILVNIMFIKSLGLYAAAISTVAGYFIMWITRVLNRNNVFKIAIDKKDFFVLISITVLALLLTFTGNMIINSCLIIISLFIFLIYNKYILTKLINFIKNKVVVG